MEKGYTVNRIFSQTIIAAVASFSLFFLNFARIYYFSKKLSVEEYGILSLFLTISSFLFYFFTLGSFEYIFRSVSKPKEISNAFWTSVIVTSVVSVVFILITYLFTSEIAQELNIAAYQSEFFILVLSNFIVGLFTLGAFYIYGTGQNNYYNLLKFSKSFWIILAIGYSLFYDLSIKAIIQIFLVASVIMLFLSIPYKYIPKLRIRIRDLDFKPVLRYCLPLIPYFLGFWGMAMVVRLYINLHHGSKILALFSVVYTLLEIVFLLVSSISGTIAPYFYAGEDERTNKLYNFMLKYSLLFIILTVPFIYILRSEIILFVTKKEYLDAIKYIPLLLILPFLRTFAAIFQQYCLKNNLTAYLGITYFSAIVFLFILSQVLIPTYAIYGAIIAILGTYLLITILLYIKQKSIIDHQQLKIKALIFFIVLGAVVTYLVELIPFNSNFWKILPLALGLGILLITLPLFSQQEKDAFQKILKDKLGK